MDAGLDSLGAVELGNAIEASVGLALPSTVVFDYPTGAALVEYLQSQLPSGGGDDEQAGGSSSNSSAAPAAAGSIVGASPAAAAVPEGAAAARLAVTACCQRTPRSAAVSAQAVDAVSAVPLERWDVEGGEATARFGSYLEQVALADMAAFGLSSSEALLMDPQQRMLLEVNWEALLVGGAAGQLPPPAERSRMGVAVGISSNEYGRMADSVTAFTATGSALSVASGRVSYIFGLQGPSLRYAPTRPRGLAAARHAPMRSCMITRFISPTPPCVPSDTRLITLSSDPLLPSLAVWTRRAAARWWARTWLPPRCCGARRRRRCPAG
jgi:hypothetical protein